MSINFISREFFNIDQKIPLQNQCSISSANSDENVEMQSANIHQWQHIESFDFYCNFTSDLNCCRAMLFPSLQNIHWLRSIYLCDVDSSNWAAFTTATATKSRIEYCHDSNLLIALLLFFYILPFHLLLFSWRMGIVKMQSFISISTSVIIKSKSSSSSNKRLHFCNNFKLCEFGFCDFRSFFSFHLIAQ